MNALAHLPWVHTAHASTCLAAVDPCPISGHHLKAASGEMEGEKAPGSVLASSTDAREDIEMARPYDPLAAEQTAFTAEEMAEIEKPKKRKKPKGWSSYQAAWLVDEEEEGDEEEKEGDEGEGAEDGEAAGMGDMAASGSEGEDAMEESSAEGKGVIQFLVITLRQSLRKLMTAIWRTGMVRRTRMQSCRRKSTGES